MCVSQRQVGAGVPLKSGSGWHHFDGSTYHQYVIVSIGSIALYRNIFEILDVEECSDVDIQLGVAHRANLCTICTSLESGDPG